MPTRGLVGVGDAHHVEVGPRRTARSATTMARSGRTTRPSQPGVSPGTGNGKHVRRIAHAPCSRRRNTSVGRCRRSLPASIGRRLPSRSPTRPRRGRRHGPPARRSSCCGSSSGWSPMSPNAGSASSPGRSLPRASPSHSRECEPTAAHGTSRRAMEPSERRGGNEMRIAVLSPVWFPVPPVGYGGIEWIVSLLADGLVDAGQEVTLFASGDSRTKGRPPNPSTQSRPASGSGTRSGSCATQSPA